MARALIVHENFLRRVSCHDLPTGKAPGLACGTLIGYRCFDGNV
jgi:hypothetical protein